MNPFVTSVTELAVLSLHSSPLAQPGTGDSGGMNVYVRELAASLAQSGRRHHRLRPQLGSDDLPRRGRGRAGLPGRARRRPVRSTCPRKSCPRSSTRSPTASVPSCVQRPVDVIHANYWLSGVAGHRLKHQLDLPLVSTFHTLARVKAETGDPEPQRRIDAEAEVIGCSDVILANSVEEVAQLQTLYGADPHRIEIVPPGVEHAFFSPGDRAVPAGRSAWASTRSCCSSAASSRSRASPSPSEPWPRCGRPDAELVVVGGPSGADGDAELHAVLALADHLGVAPPDPLRPAAAPPPAVHLLPRRRRGAWCRAGPSRSAWSPSRPPPAASRRGRRGRWAAHPGRSTARTGLLVDRRDPEAFAAAVRRRPGRPGLRRPRSAPPPPATPSGYTWSTAAARLRRIYADLALRSLVDCAA